MPQRPGIRTSATRWLGTALGRDVALMIAAFAILRVYAVVDAGVTTYPDTASYEQLSFTGAAPRLWTVPLLYTVVPSDALRVAAQATIAIACWSTLAVVVASIPRSQSLARAGAAAVLILGLTIQVTQWDLTLLSESVGNSMAVLSIAALLLVARRPSNRAFALLLGAITLWAFARHVNVIVLLAVLPFALVVIFRRCERPRAVVLAWLLTVVAVWGVAALVEEDSIWYLNSYGIFTVRMIGDPAAEAFFAERGIPITDEMRRDHEDYRGGASPAVNDPAIRQAFEDHWRSAYARWLVTHPFASIREPVGEAATLLAVHDEYATPHRVLPSPLQDLAFGRAGGDVPFWLVAVGAFWLAVRWRVRGASTLDAVAAAIVAIGALWYVVVWHLSADELPRLTLPTGLTIRLGLLVLALLALDRLLAARASGGGGAARAAAPRVHSDG